MIIPHFILGGICDSKQQIIKALVPLSHIISARALPPRPPAHYSSGGSSLRVGAPGGLFGGAPLRLFVCRVGLGWDFEGSSVTYSAEKVETMSASDKHLLPNLILRCLNTRFSAVCAVTESNLLCCIVRPHGCSSSM